MTLNKNNKLLIAYTVLSSLVLWLAVNFESMRIYAAEQFYTGGLHYKTLGWPEGARASLTLAATIGAGTEPGIAARRYLSTKLPRYDQPSDAIQLNVQGYNYQYGGFGQSVDPDKAQQYFEDCIRRYPNFEWPYTNLSNIYVDKHQYDKAEECMRTALSINPQYVNAYLAMARVKLAECDEKACRDNINRAAALDPTDPLVVKWQEFLSARGSPQAH